MTPHNAPIGGASQRGHDRRIAIAATPTAVPARQPGFTVPNHHPRHVLVLGVEDPLGHRIAEGLAAAGHHVATCSIRGAVTSPYGDASDLEVDWRRADRLSALLAGTGILCNVTNPFDEPISTLAFHLARRRRRQRERLLAVLAQALPDHPHVTMVQRSTAALYEDAGPTWVDEAFPISPPRPASATFRAEQLARDQIQRGGRAVVLRPATPYRLGDDTTAQRVTLARRGWEPFFGPEDVYRPMVEVDDAAAAFVASIDVPSGFYNVGDNNPLTVAQLNGAIATAVGRDRLHPLFASVHRSQYPLITRSCRLDNTSFRRITGWNPTGAPVTSTVLAQRVAGERSRSEAMRVHASARPGGTDHVAGMSPMVLDRRGLENST